MNLSNLILKGRVEPIVEERTFDGKTKKYIVGYRRKGKSRKRGSWTLHKPIPVAEPAQPESQPESAAAAEKEVAS